MPAGKRRIKSAISHHQSGTQTVAALRWAAFRQASADRPRLPPAAVAYLRAVSIKPGLPSVTATFDAIGSFVILRHRHALPLWSSRTDTLARDLQRPSPGQRYGRPAGLSKIGARCEKIERRRDNWSRSPTGPERNLARPRSVPASFQSIGARRGACRAFGSPRRTACARAQDAAADALAGHLGKEILDRIQPRGGGRGCRGRVQRG